MEALSFLNMECSKCGAEYTLSVALLDSGERVIHSSEETLAIFPRPKANALRFAVVGDDAGPATRLIRDLGMQTHEWNGAKTDVLFAASYESYEKRRDEIDKAVQSGARCIFLELDEGTYEIGDGQVKVTPCGMSPVHFAARVPDHPYLAGLEEQDFRFWYDPEKGYVTPLLDATFEAEVFS